MYDKPLYRGGSVTKIHYNFVDPPCLGEALRRVTLINTIMRVYPDQIPVQQ